MIRPETPVPPDPEMFEEWMLPYRSWNLSEVYLDFIARYGGVAKDVPSVGVGTEPIQVLGVLLDGGLGRSDRGAPTRERCVR